MPGRSSVISAQRWGDDIRARPSGVDQGRCLRLPPDPTTTVSAMTMSHMAMTTNQNQVTPGT